MPQRLAAFQAKARGAAAPLGGRAVHPARQGQKSAGQAQKSAAEDRSVPRRARAVRLETAPSAALDCRRRRLRRRRSRRGISTVDARQGATAWRQAEHGPLQSTDLPSDGNRPTAAPSHRFRPDRFRPDRFRRRRGQVSEASVVDAASVPFPPRANLSFPGGWLPPLRGDRPTASSARCGTGVGHGQGKGEAGARVRQRRKEQPRGRRRQMAGGHPAPQMTASRG